MKKMLLSPFVIILLLLIVLGGLYAVYAASTQEPLQNFPATVNRDCAPWDGAAFTLHVPLNDGTGIDISIWQSPDILFPKTFSFPDDTGQVGNAILIHPVGSPEMLIGEITFQPVQVGTPVEGRFSFTSEAGGWFEGQFHAEWDDQIIMCG